MLSHSVIVDMHMLYDTTLLTWQEKHNATTQGSVLTDRISGARGRDKDGVEKLRKTSYHLSLCISPDGGRE